MSKTIQTKQCLKCNEIKPISEFYKHSGKQKGYRPCCKTCFINYQKTGKGKELHQKALKKYSQTKKGKQTIRKFQCHYRQTEKGREVLRKGQKKYSQTKKGKIKQRRASDNYRKQHPERAAAHKFVNKAIVAGKLPRPDTLQCHYCPKQAKQYHHHKGYEPEFWLDVVPVCVKCHNKITHNSV